MRRRLTTTLAGMSAIAAAVLGLAVTAKQLTAGSYALTATYSGNAAYVASASAAVKVKVVK